MKKISSVVRPDKLDDVRRALNGVHVYNLSVSEMHDHTPQARETTIWRGREYKRTFSVRLQIDVIVHDDDVDEVVDTIIRTARTGRQGDGHVLVTPVEHRYSIRDGHRDVN